MQDGVCFRHNPSCINAELASHVSDIAGKRKPTAFHNRSGAALPNSDTLLSMSQNRSFIPFGCKDVALKLLPDLFNIYVELWASLDCQFPWTR